MIEYGNCLLLANVPFKFTKKTSEYKRAMEMVKKNAKLTISKRYWNRIRYFCDGPFIFEMTNKGASLARPSMMSKKEIKDLQKRGEWRGYVWWKAKLPTKI